MPIPPHNAISNSGSPDLRRSLSARLMICQTIMILLIVVVVIGAYFIRERHRAFDSLNQEADRYVANLDKSLQVPVWNFDEEAIRKICQAYVIGESVSALTVQAPHGEIYFQFEKPVAGKEVVRTRTIRYKGQKIGILRLAMNPLAFHEVEWRLMKTSILAILLIITASFFLFQLLFRRLLRRPLFELGQFAEASATGREAGAIQYSEFIPVETALARMGQTIRNQLDELRAAEEKYRSLFENAIEGIFQLSPAGRLETANPAFAEMLGFATVADLMVADAVQTPLWFLANTDREGLMARLTSQKQVVDLELPFRDNDRNRSRWGRICARVHRDGPGNVTAIDGTMMDITQQKKIEGQFHQAQKMEAIGTLAGGIAHDFNNLMMTIQGHASLIRSRNTGNGAIAKTVGAIETAVESAAGLTRQLLGLARGGKYEVLPTDINLLIQKQNALFGRTYREIAIHADLDRTLANADVDRGQIDQVLLNLYVNAVQAMPRGGRIHVKTENGWLSSQETEPHGLAPGAYVKISVTDTGVGMTPEVRQRIFDPFFTTRETGRGTGLGLASVYGIIRNHHGFITVCSEMGKGSTFNIHLPASEKPAVKEIEGDPRIYFGRGTIMLVDDEPMILDVGRQLLEELGYDVLTVDTGDQAFTLLEERKGSIDLIILDMIMPGMEGGKTYDVLRTIDSEIPVILCSGYSLNGRAAEILARGCNAFLQKPFNLQQLSQKVYETLFPDTDPTEP